MQLALKRGLWLSFFVAVIIGYLLDDWRDIGPRSVGLSAARHVALRFPDLSASQNVGLRFPDLSASQNIGLRFPDLSAFKELVLRFPEVPAVGSLTVPDSTNAAALASPASRAQIDRSSRRCGTPSNRPLSILPALSRRLQSLRDRFSPSQHHANAGTLERTQYCQPQGEQRHRCDGYRRRRSDRRVADLAADR